MKLFLILGTYGFLFFAPQILTHIAQIQTHVSVSREINLYSGESLLQNIICRLLVDCIQQYKMVVL